MKLGWVAALVCGLITAAVVAYFRPNPPQPPASAAPAPEDRSIAEALKALDQRLARIESSLAVQDSRGVREVPPVSTPEKSSPASDDLRLISQRIDALTEMLKESRKPAFAIPTIEQIRHARRDVDWTFVENMRSQCEANPDRVPVQMLGMTFNGLLQKVGVPSYIRYNDDGAWVYLHEQRSIMILFVGDTVSYVRAN